MKHRILAATHLFDGTRLLDDRVLLVQEDGTVEAIVPKAEVAESEIELFAGILMPGMVNCHCHLELSHYKGCMAPHTGLVPFLLSVVRSRVEKELVMELIEAADRELWAAGVVGVADICNTGDAIEVKKKSLLRWHNLVEVLNFRDAAVEQRMAHYREVAAAHQHTGLDAILTPHAPYSVSPLTFEAINEATAGGIISVHNQECAAEDELFRTGGGEFMNLYKELGTEGSPLAVSGKSSLQTWLPHFTKGQTILLVHNTFISEEDIVFAIAYEAQQGVRLVYCLCPNANLYIENRLPPIDLLVKHGCRIVLGTDSYSSNWQLSIASEVATIVKNFPQLELETVLQWATSNGAEVLGWKDLGRFEKGTKPGVVLLNTEDYSVRRLY